MSDNREKYQFPLKHYYGDTVRKLVFSAGILLLFTIPFDRELLGLYLVFGVLAVLLIVLFAGFTSPRQKWAVFGDLAISAFGFLFFEYFAIARYVQEDVLTDRVFLLRQAIALIFIIAVYYSTKTLRAGTES